jgi:hypothetical protein
MVLFDGIGELPSVQDPMRRRWDRVRQRQSRNRRSAGARRAGACITALVTSNLTVAEYTALQMKQAVAGHGKAAKAQVQEMVKRLSEPARTARQPTRPMRWASRSRMRHVGARWTAGEACELKPRQLARS